jgi:YidC/Oxa1 family membrane protein insertase
MSMEKRTILAFVLAMALLMVYQALFLPPSPERPPEKTAAEPPATDKPVPGRPVPEKAPAPPERASVRPQAPAPQIPAPPERPPQRLATVEGPLYRATVSSEGGKLQEFALKYRGDKPMVILGDLGPSGLLVAPGPGKPATPVAMQLDVERLVLEPGRPGSLTLSGVADGLRVRQILTFDPGGYGIDVRVSVANGAGEPRTPSVELAWSTRAAWRDAKERFQGQHPTELVWSAKGWVDRVDDLTAVPDKAIDGEWIGLGSVWYLSALLPRTQGFQLLTAGEKAPEAKNGAGGPAGRATAMTRATPTIAPGATWEGHVTVFVGPKEYDRLRALGLDGTINFGGFPLPKRWGGLPMEWLGIPILLVLNWVFAYVGNYGVAIILLTVITKILFYPLTLKSMKSMKAMQALGPQINAMRSKYKSDPQRLQRETMELYRKHKVNPLGGCLPMIAQIPIFYALYLALSVAVELQNAGFLCFGRLWGFDLWICDLAGKDPTYVLPILMGVTMFVQQKMTPTVADPRQAKIMLVMPIFFTFMFLELPSGLVLYWTVSNLLQIAQQWYMDRPVRAAAREAKDARV